MQRQVADLQKQYDVGKIARNPPEIAGEKRPRDRICTPAALAHVEQYAPCVGGALVANLDIPVTMSRHLHTDVVKNFCHIFDLIMDVC